MTFWHKYKKQLSIVSILLVLLGVWSFYEIWISYHKLEVTKYTLQSEKLEESIQMTVLADLHENSFGEDNNKLIEAVKDTDPDIIFMNGDMLNEDSLSHEDIVDLIRELRSLCPIYYALGNHEMVYDDNHPEFWQDIEEVGAVYLEKEYVDIEIDGEMLRIGGLYDYAFALDGNNSMDVTKMDADLASFLTEFRDTDSYKIMLAHRPDSFIFASEPDFWEVNLAISGHVHGGQVIVPFLGGLWAPDQGYFPEYTSGIYELGETTMAISRGLGSHRQMLPRFHNPPEIMVLEIQ